MKGIVLAAGLGTRLYPMTQVVSKQLLPVYDKPMIYYPIATLMLAGIRDILLITQPREKQLFQDLLKDGSQWGIKIDYAIQSSPEGIAQAFLIGKKFIANSNSVLILGDNIFHDKKLAEQLQQADKKKNGATVFACQVKDPENYGVVEFNQQNQPIKIEEKPKKPKSNWAVTGLYLYDNEVVEIASRLTPSARGELEITDINRCYLEKEQLKVIQMGSNCTWFDTGTPQSLLQASNAVEKLEKQQDMKIGCLEEVAWKMKYIDLNQLEKLGESFRNSYGQSILKLCEVNSNQMN